MVNVVPLNHGVLCTLPQNVQDDVGHVCDGQCVNCVRLNMGLNRLNGDD